MRRYRFPVLAALFAATVVLLSPIRADPRAPAAVIAVQVHGMVGVAHGKTAALQPLKDNDALAAGDVVETAAAGSVVLVLPNGSTVSLRESSRLAITLVLQSPSVAPDLVVYDNLKPEPSTSGTSLELMFGEIVAQVRKLIAGSDFTVQSPVGTAGVRGTEFAIAYHEDGTGGADYRLDTASGLVVFTPPGGSPAEAAASRQITVRARVDQAGVRIQQLQTHILPDETKARIQSQNEVARRDVNQALMRAKALRNLPQPPEDRTVKPEPPANSPLDRKPEPPKKPEKPVKPHGP